MFCNACNNKKHAHPDLFNATYVRNNLVEIGTKKNKEEVPPLRAQFATCAEVSSPASTARKSIAPMTGAQERPHRRDRASQSGRAQASARDGFVPVEANIGLRNVKKKERKATDLYTSDIKRVLWGYEFFASSFFCHMQGWPLPEMRNSSP